MKFLPSAMHIPLKGYGGAPVLGTLIGALLRAGHYVSAYTLDSSLSPHVERAQRFDGDRFRIYYCPLRPRAFRPQDGLLGRMADGFARERRFLGKAIADDAPDVVHAHWSYEFALAAIESGRPNVITCHDSPLEVLRYMPNLYRLGRYFMAKRVFRNAKLLTTVSPYMQRALRNLAGGPVDLVPNPLPDLIFDIAGERGDWHGCAEHPKIGIILNGWQKHKNPEPALHAFGRLRLSYPNATLHLYGLDFGPGQKAEQWAARRGIQQGMDFHGALPYEVLMRELASMDMLLHPSLEESFGMVVVEAMALGVPVVAGHKSGAVPWLLADGDCGFLAEVRSCDSILTAILSLLADADSTRSLVERARHRARSLCDASNVVAGYEKNYRAALAMHGGTVERHELKR